MQCSGPTPSAALTRLQVGLEPITNGSELNGVTVPSAAFNLGSSLVLTGLATRFPLLRALPFEGRGAGGSSHRVR